MSGHWCVIDMEWSLSFTSFLAHYLHIPKICLCYWPIVLVWQRWMQDYEWISQAKENFWNISENYMCIYMYGGYPCDIEQRDTKIIKEKPHHPQTNNFKLFHFSTIQSNQYIHMSSSLSKDSLQLLLRMSKTLQKPLFCIYYITS